MQADSGNSEKQPGLCQTSPTCRSVDQPLPPTSQAASRKAHAILWTIAPAKLESAVHLARHLRQDQALHSPPCPAMNDMRYNHTPAARAAGGQQANLLLPAIV